MHANTSFSLWTWQLNHQIQNLEERGFSVTNLEPNCG